VVENKGEGVYSFIMDRGTAATILIAAPGYKNATVAVTATNTAGATYAAAKTLTAE